MTDKIFAYYRVSVKKQADSGTLENQKAAIERFFEGRDIKVVDTFIDGFVLSLIILVFRYSLYDR